MKRSIFASFLILVFLSPGFGESGRKAEVIIRNNLFRKNAAVKIVNPFHYQFGNLHLGGPTGGSLYRFKTTPDALDRLVLNLSLQKKPLTSANEFSFPSVNRRPERPDWWQPEKVEASHYFYSIREYPEPKGARCEDKALYEPATQIIYFIHRCTGMGGV